ncbi:MAG: FAD-dependent monooxygenase, partial [Pseudomonadota bacterium]
MSATAEAADPTDSHAVVPDRADIVIGGGGLAGSLMALALAETFGDDLDVAIVDPMPRAPSIAAPQPGDNSDPRSTSIAAASKQALETLGVWWRLEADAQPITRITLTDTALDTVARMPRLSWDNTRPDPFGDDGEPASWIVPNAALMRATRQALSEHRSVQHVHAAITARDAQTNTCTLTLDTDPSPQSPRVQATPDALTAHLRTALLIAADGAASKLRRMAGIRTVGRTHDQRAIVTTVAHDLPHGDVAVQHFLPGGPFAILPLTGQRCCVTWTEDARVAERIVALDDTAFMVELEHRFGGHLGALTLAGARTTFPIATRIARDLTATRLALIGDAARSVHPIAGQGLNLAIRDIAALTECVADAMRSGLDAGDATTLKRYGQWRQFDALTSAGAFASLNALYSNDSTLLRAARDVGMGIVDRLPPLKRRLVQEASGLSGTVPKLLR